MSEQAGRYQRSFTGLVGAIIAALAAIAFVWGLTWFQHRDVPNPASTVDYAATLATARQQSPFPILAPSPPPAGWRATSVSWDGSGREVAWHLGFVTGSSEQVDYVAIEQGNAVATAFTPAVTTADEPGQPVTVDGIEWKTLHSADGTENALVLGGEHETTVITGTASVETLVEFAETLSPS